MRSSLTQRNHSLLFAALRILLIKLHGQAMDMAFDAMDSTNLDQYEKGEIPTRYSTKDLEPWDPRPLYYSSYLSYPFTSDWYRAKGRDFPRPDQDWIEDFLRTWKGGFVHWSWMVNTADEDKDFTALVSYPEASVYFYRRQSRRHEDINDRGVISASLITSTWEGMTVLLIGGTFRKLPNSRRKLLEQSIEDGP